jgi:UDP-2-acetamido-3-amino-2,3-dideoxy-glucuronate N-acetyltransferase
MAPEVFVHPQGLCESASVGAGTRIWAFAHVLRGATVGRDCNLGDYVFVEGGCVIGDRVTVKNGVQLWDGVTLEDDVMVGPCAVFTNDRFPRSPRMAAVGARYETKGWLSPIIVRRGATIGANATILPGLEVGACAMVAAGAVVTRTVAAHALVHGNPARVAGWVCVCGGVLAAVAGRLCCPLCATPYLEQDGALVAAAHGDA